MLPEIKKRKTLSDLYTEQVGGLGLPEIPQASLQMAQQMPTQEPTMPAIERKPVSAMDNYELTQNASRDAKAAGVAQMTPEKRLHWARLDNEFAAEKIRRKEEKEAEKKRAMTTNQIGNMVRSGALTPEKAVEVAKLHEIDTSPDYMANYLPKIKDTRRPTLPTIDEYKQQKYVEQQLAMQSEMQQADLAVKQSTANKNNADAAKNLMPPIVSDLDRANTAKTIAETGQIGKEKSLPPISVGQGETLVDPTSGKVIATGQIATPDIPKPSYEESLVIGSLREKLGREPLPSEILEAKNAVALKPMPATEIAKLAALKDTEKQLGELVNSYRTDYSGWFDNMMAKMGTTAGWTSKDETEFRRKLLANTTEFMYAKGGKQLSDKEMAILKSTMPDISKGDKAFKASLIAFYQQVGNIIANREQEFRDKGYRVDGVDNSSGDSNTSNNDPLGLGL
ncbi:MAG: hypothetical protein WC356_02005 [Candidatus Micrarchaeia archaeon]|jgi:hypothetical protein